MFCMSSIFNYLEAIIKLHIKFMQTINYLAAIIKFIQTITSKKQAAICSTVLYSAVPQGECMPKSLFL